MFFSFDFLFHHHFNSDLIMPVQRIPRYILLLTELKKYTPADHPDADAVDAALAQLADVAAFVNEKKRAAEQLIVSRNFKLF